MINLAKMPNLLEAAGFRPMMNLNALLERSNLKYHPIQILGNHRVDRGIK